MRLQPSRLPYAHLWPQAGRLLFWLAVYFPLFYRLDALPLQQWDEARRAVNAAEMLERGSWLVPWYGNAPEMWGTKPPLLLWLQALGLKLLGYGELAIRLPSALAGLATIALLVWFAERQLKKPLAGYLAGLVLVTTPWCGFHVTRTGDFDALLTLWLTAALLFGWLWLESLKEDEPRPRWAWLAGAAIGLAGLTKGVAGFFFLPGMLLMTAVRGQLAQALRQRALWQALPLAIGPLLAYYLAREAINPGYLAAVWQNELGGRYGQPLEGHTGPWHFYLDQLARLDVWLWVLPVALWFGFRQNRTRSLLIWMLGTLLVFLTIISAAGTKLPWYVAPAWPAIALLLGRPGGICRKAQTKMGHARHGGRAAAVCLAVDGPIQPQAARGGAPPPRKPVGSAPARLRHLHGIHERPPQVLPVPERLQRRPALLRKGLAPTRLRRAAPVRPAPPAGRRPAHDL